MLLITKSAAGRRSQRQTSETRKLRKKSFFHPGLDGENTENALLSELGNTVDINATQRTELGSSF